MNTPWRMVSARAVGYSLAAALLLAAASLDAAPDCAEWGWKPGTGVPGVNSGCVWDIASWDPDGPAGPDPEFLVVGGAACQHIAAWDGSQWQPLGSGVDKPVTALTAYGDELIAGGYFTTAGGQVSAYWARWGCLRFQGDLDGDGDVDLDDFLLFCGCVGGPHVTTPPPSCDPSDFTNGDLDADGDVDLADFAAFQAAFTGE